MPLSDLVSVLEAGGDEVVQAYEGLNEVIQDRADEADQELSENTGLFTGVLVGDFLACARAFAMN